MAATTTSATVSERTCRNHPQREAVARCPECSSYYCRECITEHEFRMICAGCLSRLASAGKPAEKTKWPRRLPVFPLVQVGTALAMAWLIFFALGRGLLRLPSAFHDGEVFGDMVEAIYSSKGDNG